MEDKSINGPTTSGTPSINPDRKHSKPDNSNNSGENDVML